MISEIRFYIHQRIQGLLLKGWIHRKTDFHLIIQSSWYINVADITMKTFFLDLIQRRVRSGDTSTSGANHIVCKIKKTDLCGMKEEIECLSYFKIIPLCKTNRIDPMELPFV